MSTILPRIRALDALRSEGRIRRRDLMRKARVSKVIVDDVILYLVDRRRVFVQRVRNAHGPATIWYTYRHAARQQAAPTDGP